MAWLRHMDYVLDFVYMQVVFCGVRGIGVLFLQIYIALVHHHLLLEGLCGRVLG